MAHHSGRNQNIPVTSLQFYHTLRIPGNLSTPRMVCLSLPDDPLLFLVFGGERWIEAERERALLGKASADGTGNSSGGVAHREEDVQAFGGGPRKCPGKVIGRF